MKLWRVPGLLVVVLLLAVLLSAGAPSAAIANGSPAAHAWAVGSGGTIRSTSDGGTTWTAQISGTTNDLVDVYFADASHGWAVGAGGTIIATDDGGGTWHGQNSGVTAMLNGVSFFDLMHGWAVGDAGTILSTTDGGSTWHLQSSGVTSWLYEVCFTDAEQGWAVGAPGILFTNDGGAHWAVQANVASINTLLYDLSLTDSMNVWAAGQYFGVGHILHTENGGASWVPQGSNLVGMYGIDFADSSYGWSVGQDGKIMSTTDGGAHWNAQTSGVSAELRKVHFIDSSTGWAVGYNGTILSTKNGGAVWSPQSSGTTAYLQAVAAIPPDLTSHVVGRATDAITGQPIPGIRAVAHASDGTGQWLWSKDTTTDANGMYNLGGLSPGTYRVQFIDEGPGYAPQYYNGRATSDVSQADDVIVGYAQTVTGINAKMAAGAHITGRVSDAATDAPIANAQVDVLMADGRGGWIGVDEVTTDASGTYDIGSLIAGIYRVKFKDGSGVHAPQFYDGMPNIDSATPIVLAAGDVAVGINGKLGPTSHITGYVAEANTNAPLSGITVMALEPDGSGGWIAAADSVMTKTGGAYDLSGIGAGSYRMEFIDGSGNHVPEFYDDVSTVQAAKDIAVGLVQTVTGIDAKLALASHIAGRVTDAKTGAPIEAAYVTVAKPDGSGGWVGVNEAQTDSLGEYDVGGLASGGYRVKFDAEISGYQIQYYKGKSSFAAAADVVLGSAKTALGIDASMYPLGSSFFIHYVPGTGGTLSGDTSQTVSYGGSGTPVTAVPNSGYQFVGWSDDATANPRTDAGVATNVNVTAKFSLSAGSTLVPDVTGMTQAHAEMVLKNAGFKTQANSVPATGTASGIVLGQDPGGGEYAPLGSTVVINVAGQLTPPQRISVTPSVLDFGDVAIGQTPVKMVTVSNTGGQSLIVISTSITSTGTNVFSVPSDVPSGTVLAPGASLTIPVTFSPTAMGSAVSVLHIYSNDSLTGTVDVPLFGTGSYPWYRIGVVPYVGLVSGNEGTAVTCMGTWSDPDPRGPIVTMTASVGTVTFAPSSGSGSWIWNYAVPDGPIDTTVTITADDANGGHGVGAFRLVAKNVAPIVAMPKLPAVAAINAVVSASASFTDPGTKDTHTALWHWDTSNPADSSPGTVNEAAGSGTVTGSHAWALAGLYGVVLDVSDGQTTTSAATQTIAIFDPARNVSGKGSFSSMPGQYLLSPTFAGSASYSVALSYAKKATAPSGSLTLALSPAMNFKATSYDWMIVPWQQTQVFIQGSGTVNGNGGYQIYALLTSPKVGSPTVAFKITKVATGQVIYDNLSGGGTPAKGTVTVH